jgi:hypothetical protein
LAAIGTTLFIAGALTLNAAVVAVVVMSMGDQAFTACKK